MQCSLIRWWFLYYAGPKFSVPYDNTRLFLSSPYIRAALGLWLCRLCSGGSMCLLILGPRLYSQPLTGTVLGVEGRSSKEVETVKPDHTGTFKPLLECDLCHLLIGQSKSYSPPQSPWEREINTSCRKASQGPERASGMLEPTRAGLQQSMFSFREYDQLVVKASVSWNWSWWKYLQHGRWKILQVRLCSPSRSRLLNAYQHTTRGNQ